MDGLKFFFKILVPMLSKVIFYQDLVKLIGSEMIITESEGQGCEEPVRQIIWWLSHTHPKLAGCRHGLRKKKLCPHQEQHSQIQFHASQLPDLCSKMPFSRGGHSHKQGLNPIMPPRWGQEYKRPAPCPCRRLALGRCS